MHITGPCDLRHTAKYMKNRDRAGLQVCAKISQEQPRRQDCPIPAVELKTSAQATRT
jgi:hypothetical protein